MLNGHGFEISEFGRNFFRLEAVPDWIQPGVAEEWVRDLLGWLREGRLHVRELNVAREELARFAVARPARGAEQASESEVHTLLSQLFDCRSPMTSPQGRPTLVEMSHGELARRFGR